jgi:hypothetical protein
MNREYDSTLEGFDRPSSHLARLVSGLELEEFHFGGGDVERPTVRRQEGRMSGPQRAGASTARDAVRRGSRQAGTTRLAVSSRPLPGATYAAAIAVAVSWHCRQVRSPAPAFRPHLLVIARPQSVTAPFLVKWVRRSEVTLVRYRMVASSRTKSYGRWQAARARVKGKVRASTDSFEERPNAGHSAVYVAGFPAGAGDGTGFRRCPGACPSLVTARVPRRARRILDTDTTRSILGGRSR